MTPALHHTENNAPARYTRLMREGHLALSGGHPRRAHRFWREAAMLHPVSEQVWLALLTVVDNEADRQVCLQNIVAINPNNLSARQRLESYLDDTHPSNPIIIPETGTSSTPEDALLPVLRVVEAVLIGLLLSLFILLLPFVSL